MIVCHPPVLLLSVAAERQTAISTTDPGELRARGSSSLRSRRSGESLESLPTLSFDVDTEDDSDDADDEPVVAHAYIPPEELGLGSPPGSPSPSSSLSLSSPPEESRAVLPVAAVVQDAAEAIANLNIRDDFDLQDTTDLLAEVGSWIDPKTIAAARPKTLEP